MKHCKDTIQELLDEADRNAVEARKAFDLCDNIEDMHERDRWEATSRWLRLKLSPRKTKAAKPTKGRA